MDVSKDEQNRKEFRSILLDLAKSQELFEKSDKRYEMYKRLEKLYYDETTEKQFRHYYSDLFSILTQIQQNPELGDINILGQNLELIRKGYKPQNIVSKGKVNIDISNSIRKLYDHVSLDIARISYSDAADRKVSGEEAINDLRTQIDEVKNKLENSQKEYKDIENKLENSQREYIAILGIFAAVVLAFTGSIAYSTSVLNNISQVSAYKTIVIATLIGVVMVNVLFGLFYYINSLVNKKRMIFPLVISNAVLIVILLLAVIAWSYGAVEKRDARILNNNVNVESR
jgi:hypothetical protein